MTGIRRFLLVGLAVALFAGAPVAAEAPNEGGDVEADTYLAMWDEAQFRGVERPADDVYDLFIRISGDPELDERIRSIAEFRGYVRQPLAATELVPVDGRLLQAPAAEAWEAMQAEARAAGIGLVLTSAYRDLAGQQDLFRDRLGGRTSDGAIFATLRLVAPPGYSKHHTGFAVDIGEAGVERGGFADTRAYAWLSADDFARPKAHGFVPSYPEGGDFMGPDPEAWEFVWVGTGRIACALGAAFPTGFCDVGPGPRADDISWLRDIGVTVGCAPDRFCPDDPVLRGEAASLLWRLHGAPTPTTRAPFVDVFDDDHFASAVAWMWEEGLTTGTSDTTFSPDALLTPVEAFALIVRVGDAELPPPVGLVGPVVEFAAEVELGEIGPQLSRAEFATVLRSIAVDL